MEKILTFFIAGMTTVALCGGTVACNDPGSRGHSDNTASQEQSDNPGSPEQSDDSEAVDEPFAPGPELGEVIPGIEVKQATGTVIGSYSNGFGSLLVQVDEDFSIGEALALNTGIGCTTLPRDATYRNTIQVQYKLPIKVGDKILFSFREILKDKDDKLFTVSLVQNDFCMPPNVSIYVITDFKIINN